MRTAAAALLGASVLWWTPAGAEVSYEGPESYEVENRIVLEQARGVVWDRIVRNLRSDTFREVKANDLSHVIQVKFESTDPTNLIDCGRTTRIFAGDHGPQHFDYPTADSTYYLSRDSEGDTYNVTRISLLEGRAYITVEEVRELTAVTVRALFIWRIFLEYSDLEGRVSANNSATFTFSTDDPLADDRAGAPECFSRGLIENRILFHAR